MLYQEYATIVELDGRRVCVGSSGTCGATMRRCSTAGLAAVRVARRIRTSVSGRLAGGRPLGGPWLERTPDSLSTVCAGNRRGSARALTQRHSRMCETRVEDAPPHTLLSGQPIIEGVEVLSASRNVVTTSTTRPVRAIPLKWVVPGKTARCDAGTPAKSPLTSPPRSCRNRTA